jgi:hypothetical protein
MSSEEDILKRLGSDRVFQELAARQKAQVARIEGSELKRESYSRVQLTELFELRKQLFARLGVNPKSKLREVESVMDRRDFWKHKFSTQPGSGDVNDLARSPQDSIYYLTPNGLSLRLKKILAYSPQEDEPLVYPVFEKAVFHEDGQEGYVLAPRIGLWTGEFASSDFLKLQRDFMAGKPLPPEYQSKLGFYEKGGKIVGVASELKGEDPYHNGDRVNHIYF